jgi:hypothetical protein
VSLRALLLAAISCMASCTLRGLSERIVQEPCTSNEDCKVLNDTNAVGFDSCHPYLCVDSYCRKLKLDMDHDGFADRACESNRALQDCDDQAPDDHPGAPEVCDARDNDCDKRVDEGVLESVHGLMLEFEPGRYATQLSFAPDLDLHTTTVAYALDPRPSTVFLNQFATDGVLNPNIAQLELQPSQPLIASSFATADVPNAAIAFAAFTPTGSAAVITGLMDWPNPVLLLNASVAIWGAHCEPEETCFDQSVLPVEPTPESRALTLASGIDGTLLAYLRTDSESSACDDGPRSAAPLLTNLFAAGAGGLYERSQSALRVATTEDHRPPALLALPTTTGNDVTHGFLLAYASSNGQIVFHHIAVTTSGELVLSTPLLKLRSDEGRLGAPRLALGDREQAQSTKIGLSVERGCGAERRVLFKQLSAALADDGSVALNDDADWLSLSDLADQGAAALNWNPSRGSWGLIYRDTSGLNARVLDGDFVPEGDKNYLLAPAVALPPGAADATAVVSAPLSYHWYDIFEQAPGGIARHILQSCR